MHCGFLSRFLKNTFWLCAVLLLACGWCFAQSSTTVAQGELRLDGAVAAYDAASGKLVLDADSFTLASGKSSSIAPAKAKTILVNAQTAFVDASGKNTAKPPLPAGAHVAIIGSDGGSGKPLIARLVILLDASGTRAPTPASKSAAASNQDTGAMKMQPGEFLLNGQIKGIFSAQSIVIEVFKRTDFNGQVEEMNQPVEQKLHLDANTKIRSQEDAAKTLTIGDVKLGQRVSLVGKYGGEDEPFNVREMGVWKEEEQNLHSIGVVTVSPQTASLLEQGHAAYRAGAYPEALQYYLKASQVAGELGDTNGNALAQNSLGLTYNALDQPKLAQAAYIASLNLSLGVGDYSTSSVTMSNLADFYQGQGDADDALKCYDTVQGWIDTNNFSGKDRLRLDVLSGQARAQDTAKQPDKAIDTMHQAIALAQQLNDIDIQESGYLLLAFWQLDNQQTDEAADDARQCASLIPQLKDPADQAQSWRELYLYYRLAKDDKNAQPAYDQATLLLTNLKDTDGLQKLEALKEKLDKNAQEPQTPQ